jgi:hypothetical protein
MPVDRAMCKAQMKAHDVLQAADIVGASDMGYRYRNRFRFASHRPPF